MEKMQKKTDGSVSLVRITGMVCILLCHLSTWLGFFSLTQLFNVGVPVFLLISGYLYGEKQPKPIPFLKKRYVKLTVPVILFVLVLAVYFLASGSGDANYAAIPLFLFNLQGASFLTGWIPYLEFCSGTAHLWFLTVLMVCYGIMLFVKRLEKKCELSKKSCIVLLIVSCVVTAALVPAKIYVSYVQIYFIGYWYGQKFNRMTTRKWIVASMLMTAGILTRLYLHRTMDDSTAYMIAVALSQNMLAFWIFSCFKWLYDRNGAWIDRLAQTKVICHIDAISYYVYIVHYMFLVGPFEVDRLGWGRIPELAVFFVATVVCAEALYLLQRPVEKLIRQRI